MEKDFGFIGDNEFADLNWLEREISSASAEVAALQAGKRNAMRREVAAGGGG